jgi:hypothetical protein
MKESSGTRSLKIFGVLLLFPLLVFSQQKEPPYVTIKEGKIFYYLPAHNTDPRLLPARIPGFVVVAQTALSASQPTKQVRETLITDLSSLTDKKLTLEQKQAFLEMFACLLLLDYSDVSAIDSKFIELVRKLGEDRDSGIRADAGLVVRMYEMYKIK